MGRHTLIEHIVVERLAYARSMQPCITSLLFSSFLFNHTCGACVCPNNDAFAITVNSDCWFFFHCLIMHNVRVLVNSYVRTYLRKYTCTHAATAASVSTTLKGHLNSYLPTHLKYIL